VSPQDGYRYLVGATLLIALETADRELRVERPDLFSKVDAIKADPGRVTIIPPERPMDFSRWTMRVCPRCRGSFATSVNDDTRYCSRACYRA
jgi:hypothetical protein